MQEKPLQGSMPPMQAERLGGRRAAAYAALLLGSACGSASPSTEPEQRNLDIIGGFRANSPALDVVGALVIIDPSDGTTVETCTATLIAPETVVTAKHCVEGVGFLEQEGLGLGWGVGPDPYAPRELIPAASVETAPGDEGGFVELGRDVAVVHLESPSDIAPALLPRPFGADFVGTAMVQIGYGVYGARGLYDGQRRIGRVTVAGVEGRTFEHMLGSFENFVEWHQTREVTESDFLANSIVDEETLRQYREEFDAVVLLDEAVAGLAATDTQSCFGDSGGPVALIGEDGVEVYGVVSGGIPSSRRVCDYGGVYAMFGEASFAFLEREIEWVDPCGDETQVGRCDGEVARRCETSLENRVRRLASEDCAAQGLACVTSAVGVGCGTVTEPDRAIPPDEADIDAVLRAVQDASRPKAARRARTGREQ